MNGNNEKSTDLITHYFDNEAGHILILVTFLENEKQLNEKILFSNLFNFKIDFHKKEVTIEDQCRLFLASNPEGFQKIKIDKLLLLCKKAIDKK